jgi:hypothetical protein
MAKAAKKPARKPTKASVKAAADRAEARAKGEEVAPAADPVMSPPETIGRPTKYRSEFAEKARRLCELGATDADLAMIFEVNTSTIWRWQVEHDDFCNALMVGKSICDDRVERSLYQRAVGYSFNSQKIMQDKGCPVIVPYVEHVPPDPGAAKLWLTNRRPKAWREKTEIQHDGTAAFLQCLKKMNGASA